MVWGVLRSRWRVAVQAGAGARNPNPYSYRLRGHAGAGVVVSSLRPRLMSSKFKLPQRYGSGEKSVWVEYIQLAAEARPAVNLGQGFPDYPVASRVTRALADVTTGPDPLLNQYTRGYGHPRLVRALAGLYSPLVGRDIDPMSEVLVTAGAYEALYCAIMGHVDSGDEVIVIEPFFDCYDPMIRAAGGVPRFIPLEPRRVADADSPLSSDDWRLDEAALRALFSARTKMLILNTPHNPLGKVFSEPELRLLAELCVQHDVLCLSDEVYEWLVYPPRRHLRIATLPGMWERTVTVGSAGKTFSATGWKTGWAYGHAPLMNNLYVVHQNCVYTHTTPVQEAIARCLERSTAAELREISGELLPKRELLVRVLRDAGFLPTVPDGGYFIVADWSPLARHVDLSDERDARADYRFTKHMCRACGVLAIPPSAFYSEPHKQRGETYARFCFIKKDENLQLVEKLFKEWKEKMGV